LFFFISPHTPKKSEIIEKDDSSSDNEDGSTHDAIEENENALEEGQFISPLLLRRFNMWLLFVDDQDTGKKSLPSLLVDSNNEGSYRFGAGSAHVIASLRQSLSRMTYFIRNDANSTPVPEPHSLSFSASQKSIETYEDYFGQSMHDVPAFLLVQRESVSGIESHSTLHPKVNPIYIQQYSWYTYSEVIINCSTKSLCQWHSMLLS
jgi:hypothetical protein